MVSWVTLCAAIAKNSERGFQIPVLKINESVIDTFLLPKLLANTVQEDDEELPLPPPPTKCIAVAVPPSVDTPPPVSRPVHAPLPTAKPIRLPQTMKLAVDPMVVGIELVEPLYVGAPFNNKQAIEVAVAIQVEGQMNELYKTEGGRSRGWTKSGLDLWLKPRSASGGNLKDLDRAKAGFVWQLLMDDKAQSAFLDYVCVAKRIRIAVWFDETKTVLVYPAADSSAHLGQEFPLYHVSSSGHLMNGPATGKELYKVCEAHKYTALPPISVMGALSGLKLEELENVGKQLGMPSVEGKKIERVAAIAAYKLRQRFGL